MIMRLKQRGTYMRLISDSIHKLLECMPFDSLLHNAWRHTKFSVTIPSLKHFMKMTTLNPLSHSLDLILGYLSVLLLSNGSDAMHGRLALCLDLLSCGLNTARMEKDANIRSHFSSQIFEHPSMVELNAKLLEQVHQLHNKMRFLKTVDAKASC